MKLFNVMLLSALSAWIEAGPVPGRCQALPSGQSPGHVSNVSITSSGKERSFLVFIPPGYSKDQPTPAILSYHGGVRDAEDQLHLDQLTSADFNPGSLVIYPQGIQDTWQGVPGVKTDDIKFTADILDYVESHYTVDKRRIYATGKSDGGGFTNVLACDADMSLRFAAFAPVSGAFYIDAPSCNPDTVSVPCNAQRDNIPFIEFHGGNDTTIHYDGGARQKECLPSIPHFIQQWALRDDLGSSNQETHIAPNTVRYRFGSGSTEGLVEHYFESDIGHDWPSTVPNDDNQRSGHHVASYNATPIIVDFFSQHSL
ncbi:carbohydrate esterase family 1 [Fusarium globosum]|uniref:feruloyl esterase n=1 Tax=Fusarium globosum TaxID=78864 RepID=A0A8H5YTS2_9HYPO|nr:carbohydrate esterase family 1 [Fusarium globosum]